MKTSWHDIASYSIIVLKVPLNDVTCTGDFLTSRRPCNNDNVVIKLFSSLLTAELQKKGAVIEPICYNPLIWMACNFLQRTSQNSFQVTR